MEPTVTKKRVFAVVSVVIGIALALVVAEFALRGLEIGYATYPVVSDPVLHHAHLPNSRFVIYSPHKEYGGHTIYFDEERLVSAPEPTMKLTGAPVHRVAFLGDSFVESLQVDFSKSFVGRLQEGAAGCTEMKNYGVSSYSPIFYLLQWRNLVSKLKPTHVFVMLYWNDIKDDKRMRKIAEYSESGDLLAIPGPGDDWLRRKLLRLYVARWLRRAHLTLSWILSERTTDRQKAARGRLKRNPDITSLSSKLVFALADEVRRSNAQFILTVVPSKHRLIDPESKEESEHSDKWKAWARNKGIEFLDLVPSFREAYRPGLPLFFSKDIHFTERGHAVVAETVRNAYPLVFSSECQSWDGQEWVTELKGRRK
jgi:hypothetical protein